MSTHLILGGTGLVGTHVAAAATAAGHRVVCTGLTSDLADIRLDLRDPAGVQQVILESGAAVVFVPAAFTNVEACETDPQKSFAVNVRPLRGVVEQGPHKSLEQMCVRLGGEADYQSMQQSIADSPWVPGLVVRAVC